MFIMKLFVNEFIFFLSIKIHDMLSMETITNSLELRDESFIRSVHWLEDQQILTAHNKAKQIHVYQNIEYPNPKEDSNKVCKLHVCFSSLRQRRDIVHLVHWKWYSNFHNLMLHCLIFHSPC